MQHKIDISRLKVITVGCLVLMVVLFLVGIGTGFAMTRDGPPSPPSWVKPDGTIDPGKIPAKVWVVDSSGKRAGYVDGLQLFAPPPPPGTGSDSLGLPVKNESGEVIGNLIPQRGFVPLTK